VILADTSVWVDHLRAGRGALAAWLDAGQVATHDFVIGELACGHLMPRRAILEALADLPRCPMASPEEVLYFIERHRLAGRGIGYVDIHLLASAVVSEVRFWTKDKRLAAVAKKLDLHLSEGTPP